MKVNFPLCQDLPPCAGGQVQTRSEETGLIQHDTLETAVKLAEEDETIWKISYQTPKGWLRQVIR